MRDLRKKALLESGKTTSRKARSKETTPSSSRGNSLAPSPRASRVNSAINSANVSDDESEYSDVTQWSTHSIDELIAGSPELDDGSNDAAWIADLNQRIEEICDRKRSSFEGREYSLAHFDSALTRHFAEEEIKARISELLPSILKCVKNGATEKETVLALKALALILVTNPSETVYDAVASSVKMTIADSEYTAAKIAAIHTLGTVTFYGGASEEETEDTMAFFLDIASSDGATINEQDNGEAVVAALEEWGFLATQLEDIEDATEEAMETFVDQLESANVDVQIAAGDNIALLFEKSFTELESDDEIEEDDVEENGEGEKMVKRYTVYRQQQRLEKQLETLSKSSSKRLSKKDRKALHQAFTDILNTVEKPTRGPRYSTALDEDGNEMGSRLKIAVPGGGKMTIDTWWKLHRLNALKRLLGAGFMVHYQHNQVVFDTLPIAIEHD